VRCRRRITGGRAAPTAILAALALGFSYYTFCCTSLRADHGPAAPDLKSALWRKRLRPRRPAHIAASDGAVAVGSRDGELHAGIPPTCGDSPLTIAAYPEPTATSDPGEGDAMGLSRSDCARLAEKVCGDLPLNPTDFHEFVKVLEGAIGAASAPHESNLVPWPDADELRRLSERSARRHKEKA